MGIARLLTAAIVGASIGLMGLGAAEAQQAQSRLFEITKSKKLRVCQFPLYYSILPVFGLRKEIE